MNADRSGSNVKTAADKGGRTAMRVGTAVLSGLAAGLAGTAAMTVSETLEMRMTAREPSTVPGQVGSKLLGRSLDTDSPQRLNAVVHWTHGVAMGTVRGLLGLTGVAASTATALHFGIVWGGDAVLYRTLGLAPAPWRWQRQELITDLFHKGVYAAAAGATFELLRSAVRPRTPLHGERSLTVDGLPADETLMFLATGSVR